MGTRRLRHGWSSHLAVTVKQFRQVGSMYMNIYRKRAALAPTGQQPVMAAPLPQPRACGPAAKTCSAAAVAGRRAPGRPAPAAARPAPETQSPWWGVGRGVRCGWWVEPLPLQVQRARHQGWQLAPTQRHHKLALTPGWSGAGAAGRPPPQLPPPRPPRAQTPHAPAPGLHPRGRGGGSV